MWMTALYLRTKHCLKVSALGSFTSVCLNGMIADHRIQLYADDAFIQYQSKVSNACSIFNNAIFIQTGT